MTRVRGALAMAAAVLGLAAGAAGTGRPDAARLAAEIDAERDHISAPDLADRIMRRDPALRVIDLRSRAEYEAFHIPTAVHSTLGDLARGHIPKGASVVLYSEGGAHAAQAWMLLRLRGYRDVTFLREGLYEWMARVVEPRLADNATEAERADFARAETQSRFFGGLPRSDVPRGDVPVGYWTSGTGHATGTAAGPAADLVGRVRRRGC